MKKHIENRPSLHEAQPVFKDLRVSGRAHIFPSGFGPPVVPVVARFKGVGERGMSHAQCLTGPSCGRKGSVKPGFPRVQMAMRPRFNVWEIVLKKRCPATVGAQDFQQTFRMDRVGEDNVLQAPAFRASTVHGKVTSVGPWEWTIATRLRRLCLT